MTISIALLYILLFSFVLPVITTKLPEIRLKCTEDYVLIGDDVANYENNFRRFSIEIGEPDGKLAEIMKEKCENLPSRINENTRKRRGVGTSLKAFLKLIWRGIKSFGLESLFISYAAEKTTEAIMNHLNSRGGPFEDNEVEIRKSLKKLLNDRKLTDPLIHYHKIYKHIDSHLSKTTSKIFLKTASVENLRCEPSDDDENYSITFDLIIPLHQRLTHIRTCGDVGEIDKYNYYYHMLEGSIFWNSSGVFKVDTNYCEYQYNVQICPNDAVSATRCSLYEPDNCTFVKKSLNFEIVRELPVGNVIYGSAKHVLISKSNGTYISVFGVEPYILLYLNPGEEEVFEYGIHKFEWRGGRSVIEEL